MEKIALRHAEPSDHPHIIGVVDGWWGGRPMVDMLPKLFFVHFRPTCFVAECAGEIVGFVVGFMSQTFADEAYIHFVGVHPDFRSRDLGRMLYEHFFAAAARLGAHTVRCVTSPVNKGSIAFHRRMGFLMAESDTRVDGIAVAQAYDGQGEDRVLFSKRLGKERAGAAAGGA